MVNPCMGAYNLSHVSVFFHMLIVFLFHLACLEVADNYRTQTIITVRSHPFTQHKILHVAFMYCPWHMRKVLYIFSFKRNPSKFIQFLFFGLFIFRQTLGHTNLISTSMRHCDINTRHNTFSKY